jgi:hypothetical protein
MDYSEDRPRRATNKCVISRDANVHIEPVTAHFEYDNTVRSLSPRMMVRKDILHFDGNDTSDVSDCYSDDSSDWDDVVRPFTAAMRKDKQKGKKLPPLAATQEDGKKTPDTKPEGSSNAESTESPVPVTLCPRLSRLLNGLFSQSPKIAEDLLQKFIATNHEDSHFPTTNKAFHADCVSFGYQLSETQLSRFEHLQGVVFAHEGEKAEQNSDKSVPDEIVEFLSGAVNKVKGVIKPAFLNARRRLQEKIRECEEETELVYASED